MIKPLQKIYRWTQINENPRILECEIKINYIGTLRERVFRKSFKLTSPFLFDILLDYQRRMSTSLSQNLITTAPLIKIFVCKAR